MIVPWCWCWLWPIDLKDEMYSTVEFIDRGERYPPFEKNPKSIIFHKCFFWVNGAYFSSEYSKPGSGTRSHGRLNKMLYFFLSWKRWGLKASGPFNVLTCKLKIKTWERSNAMSSFCLRSLDTLHLKELKFLSEKYCILWGKKTLRVQV